MPTSPATTTGPASVTDGLVNRHQLAADLKRSERTIVRWERAGMPFIPLGMLRFYDPAKVRAWIIGHERVPQEPRRGRPGKRAA